MKWKSLVGDPSLALRALIGTIVNLGSV